MSTPVLDHRSRRKVVLRVPWSPPRSVEPQTVAARVASGAVLGYLAFVIVGLTVWIAAQLFTAAAEALVHLVGFSGWSIGTIWDWLIVLVVGALLIAVLTAAFVAAAMVFRVAADRRQTDQLADRVRALGYRAARIPTSKRPRPDDHTRAELYTEARQRGVRGASRMTKAQLARALSTIDV